MKGNNVQSANAQIPLLWPHIPTKYLKVFGYWRKDRGGDWFSFSMEILNLNALESALSVRLPPPLCWALQEEGDIWDRADLTAHYNHPEGFQTLWGDSQCSEMFRGICKTFVQWTFEVKLIKYTKSLAALMNGRLMGCSVWWSLGIGTVWWGFGEQGDFKIKP